MSDSQPEYSLLMSAETAVASGREKHLVEHQAFSAQIVLEMLSQA